MTTDAIIRPLTLAEAEMLVDWARMEGWNPGLGDASAFHAADPTGFIGCFVGGKLATGISAVRYGENFSFIGLYIAHPDFRGKGLGRKVWEAGMSHLQGRTIGLDGVLEQQANYRSMGFEPAYETFRWSGTLAGEATSDVTSLDADQVPAILSFDRRFFPTGRTKFLAEWLKPPRVTKTIIRDGGLQGYAVCRRCHDGYKIGPLFARTADDAELLLKSWAAETGGEVLHVDVPAYQAGFTDKLAKHGFSKGFTTARMYRGLAPSVEKQGIFGVTTLELG